MSKNILFGLILILVIGSVLNYKFYIDNKNKMVDEYKNLINIESKMKMINYLKSRYKIDLKPYKKYCNIKSLSNRFILECSDLNKKEFKRVENIFKKAKIDKFSIIRSKDVVKVKLEILK